MLSLEAILIIIQSKYFIDSNSHCQSKIHFLGVYIHSHDMQRQENSYKIILIIFPLKLNPLSPNEFSF